MHRVVPLSTVALPEVWLLETKSLVDLELCSADLELCSLEETFLEVLEWLVPEWYADHADLANHARLFIDINSPINDIFLFVNCSNFIFSKILTFCFFVNFKI